MPLSREIQVYQFLQSYGESLLAELATDRTLTRMSDTGHHPMWLMGHLAFVGQRMVAAFGGEPAVDLEDYGRRFGIGSELSDNPDDYPTWNQVLGVWRDAHRQLPELAPSLTDEQLAEPNENPRMSEALPTKADFYAFVLTGHEAMHLGQLSAWRRSQGLPRLF